jgi:hypothetical protein
MLLLALYLRVLHVGRVAALRAVAAAAEAEPLIRAAGLHRQTEPLDVVAGLLVCYRKHALVGLVVELWRSAENPHEWHDHLARPHDRHVVRVADVHHPVCAPERTTELDFELAWLLWIRNARSANDRVDLTVGRRDATGVVDLHSAVGLQCVDGAGAHAVALERVAAGGAGGDFVPSTYIASARLGVFRVVARRGAAASKRMAVPMYLSMSKSTVVTSLGQNKALDMASNANRVKSRTTSILLIVMMMLRHREQRHWNVVVVVVVVTSTAKK